jgi:hypothetical protein
MNTTSRLFVHDPDGIPHEVVGLTWLLAVAIAVIAFAALTIGGIVTGFALVLVPTYVIGLARQARRQRDAREAAVLARRV